MEITYIEKVADFFIKIFVLFSSIAFTFFSISYLKKETEKITYAILLIFLFLAILIKGFILLKKTWTKKKLQEA